MSLRVVFNKANLFPAIATVGVAVFGIPAFRTDRSLSETPTATVVRRCLIAGGGAVTIGSIWRLGYLARSRAEVHAGAAFIGVLAVYAFSVGILVSLGSSDGGR